MLKHGHRYAHSTGIVRGSKNGMQEDTIVLVW